MADKSKWKGKNLSYMTPQMLHAMKMSQTQSQNTYKKTYNESVKGKGSSATDTVETRRVRKLTTEQSLLNYHKDFENSKSKGYTAVTETPELQRIRQQSHRDVNYKKEFMEQKGHNIPVAETPDTVRVKKQQKIVSDIKYQEDREKLKGKATQVVDDPSTRRAMQAAKIASDIEYKKSKEKTEEMERKRQDINTTSQKSASHASLVKSHVAPTRHPGLMQSNIIHHGPLKRWRRQPGSIFDYDPSDYETEQEYESGLVTKKHDDAYKLYHTDTEADFVSAYNFQPKKNIVSWREYPSGKAYKHVAAPGNIADYDPAKQMERMSMKDKEPEIVSTSPQPTEQVQDPSPEPEPVTAPEAVSDEQDQEIFEEFVRKSDGHIYKAMFDYVAQDDDEVSFQDGDTIINAQRIDDGWMFGTVERTAQTGMLPSNYVQVIQ